MNQCVIKKLKFDLKNNKAEAVRYMRSCFDEMLDDESFVAWLSKAVELKPNRLKKLLSENLTNKRNSEKLPLTSHQEIYNFWLKSITSTDSTNNLKRISKKAFLEKYKGIDDSNLMEEIVPLKNGTKLRYRATKMIYVESIRKLRLEFNLNHAPVSLTTFYKLKPFYCVVPSEKEKQSCVCINCQNPHLLLESINRYRTSRNLIPHASLTKYLEKLKAGEKFEELTDDHIYTYHKYERVEESYIKKDGTPAEYKRVTRIDHHEAMRDICQQIVDTGSSYLKHRTYVDNVSSIFPEMKSMYDGKYIELDFSQNLALRPKDEVQSAHFSGKQFTLHCSIDNPVTNRYHYHLSDDTNHDSVFVDHVIRDIVQKYQIRDEDLWIQSDNASSQYKNKHAFSLLKKLSSDFNLRIIGTYGAAGHGKGAIDGMFSFGVKNILRKDIVTHNVFFNKSEDVVDYFQMKCPKFSYTHLPCEDVVQSRIGQDDPMIIKNCMKQHLMVFSPDKAVSCKEYLCSCHACLEFNFEECSGDDAPVYSDLPCNDYYGDDEDAGCC